MARFLIHCICLRRICVCTGFVSTNGVGTHSLLTRELYPVPYELCNVRSNDPRAPSRPENRNNADLMIARHKQICMESFHTCTDRAAVPWVCDGSQYGDGRHSAPPQ